MWKTKKIKNGIVIDHVLSGKGLELYNLLKLNSTDYPSIVIRNADSKKMGKKDIIKVWNMTDIALDIIGYFDSNITVNIIRNQKICKVQNINRPKYVKNVLYCKNVNCVTSIESGIDHIFKLTDLKNKKYSCIYCDY